MSSDGDDCRSIRNTRAVEDQLRQFLSYDGPKGANSAYQRGWRFNFEFTDEQRARVNELMTQGKSFSEAFDEVELAAIEISKQKESRTA